MESLTICCCGVRKLISAAIEESADRNWSGWKTCIFEWEDSRAFPTSDSCRCVSRNGNAAGGNRQSSGNSGILKLYERQ